MAADKQMKLVSYLPHPSFLPPSSSTHSYLPNEDSESDPSHRRRDGVSLSPTNCNCLSSFFGGLCLAVLLIIAIAIPVTVFLTRTGSTTTMMTTTTMITCASTGVVYPPTLPTCATWNQTGITVAGNQNGIAGSDLKSLSNPIDIFVDNNYTLFVADGTNNRIIKYYANAASGILVAGSGPGSNSSQLDQPKGVAVDQMGNVFVGDTANYRIQRFPCNSMVGTTVAINSSTSLLGITRDLHVDINNNIYVTDSDYNRVVMFYLNNGTSLIIAGNNGLGPALNQFSSPFGSFIDENQTLYVADYANYRVQMWPAGATSGITVAGITGSAGSSLKQLSNPISVVVDTNGYIYVADYANNRIVKWTTNYTAGGICVVGCTGTTGTGADQLAGPRDLKFDSSGNLYVSDQGNNRVQKFMIQLSTSRCTFSG